MRLPANKKHFLCSAIILILMLHAFACNDHGIEPRGPESSGFGGRITFINEWPDSVKRSFIVVFEDPLLSDSDFTIFNLKYLSREIPLGVPVYNFSSLDSSYIPPEPGPFPAGSYAYVAVVQQSTDQLSFARKDWFVSGVYYANNDTTTPGTMVIPDSTFVRDIDITVDFNNPPPQPPGNN
jgi:hypothetical protein